MSWDKLEIEIHQESFRQRNEIISGKKGNDSMNLQKMTIEELKDLGKQIDSLIQYREEMEVKKITDEFLAVWKKMEKMGFCLDSHEIGEWKKGKKIKDIEMEINGKLIEIRE